VDKEMTVMSGTVHRDLVDPFVEIFLDAVLDPGFREDDFTRIKDTTISGIEKSLRYSSDEDLGKAALFERIFAGSRYAHIVDGTVTALRSITLDDVRSFHAARFTRDNVVIGLAGAYADALPGELSAALARLPAGKPDTAPAPRPAPISGRELLLVEKPGPSTAISFGFPIDLARGSRDYYALWIANSWLGEHRNSSSHLYQVIREARGMNYGDYSYIEAYPNGGRLQLPPTGVARRGQIFEVWIRPVPRAQAHFALRAALRELEALTANGLTEKQFAYQYLKCTQKYLKCTQKNSKVSKMYSKVSQKYLKCTQKYLKSI
jgi:zinc protease